MLIYKHHLFWVKIKKKNEIPAHTAKLTTSGIKTVKFYLVKRPFQA
jgi:hypothetical protein